MTCVSCGIDDTMYTITVKVCREDFEKVNNALTKAVFGSLLGDLERITIKKEMIPASTRFWY